MTHLMISSHDLHVHDSFMTHHYHHFFAASGGGLGSRPFDFLQAETGDVREMWHLLQSKVHLKAWQNLADLHEKRELQKAGKQWKTWKATRNITKSTKCSENLQDIYIVTSSAVVIM